MNKWVYPVSIVVYTDKHKKAPPGEGEASWIIGELAVVFDCFDVVRVGIAYGASKWERDPVGVQAS